MYETIDEYLKTSFYNNEEVQKRMAAYETLVNNNEMTSFAAAHKLIDFYNSL